MNSPPSRHISRLRSLTVFLSGGGAQPNRTEFDLVSKGREEAECTYWNSTSGRKTRTRMRREMRRGRRNRSQRATRKRRRSGKKIRTTGTQCANHVIALRPRIITMNIILCARIIYYYILRRDRFRDRTKRQCLHIVLLLLSSLQAHVFAYTE